MLPPYHCGINTIYTHNYVTHQRSLFNHELMVELEAGKKKTYHLSSMSQVSFILIVVIFVNDWLVHKRRSSPAMRFSLAT